MMNDAKTFVKDIHNNVSTHQLIEKYSWLDHFDILINSNCNIISNNLKHLRYTGYAMVLHNTVMIHILLSGILPVTVFSCGPILASLISGFINPAQIFLVGIFQIEQILFTMITMLVFIILEEKKLQSERRLNSSLHKFC